MRDLGALSFTVADEVIRKAMLDLREYLSEVGADPAIQAAIENTAPDQMRLVDFDPTLPKGALYAYPPLVSDWLVSRCRAKGHRAGGQLAVCVSEEFLEEQEAARSR